MNIPQTITEDEFRQLLKGTNQPHHRLAFRLGFYQCMRVSEVVKLRPENVETERGWIHILDSKGGKDRDVPIVPEMMRKLNSLPVGCGARALQIAIRRISQKAIGKSMRFHQLRHSGATFYLNARKKDIRYIQQFLGHSRLDTTQIYTHVTPEDLKREFG